MPHLSPQVGDLVRIPSHVIARRGSRVWLWSESRQDDVPVVAGDLGLIVGRVDIDSEEFVEVLWGGWGIDSITVSSSAMLESVLESVSLSDPD